MRVRTYHSEMPRRRHHEGREGYRLRLLTALAVSVSLVLLCTHLPIYQASLPVGWYFTHAPPITLDVIEMPEASGGDVMALAPPQTRHEAGLNDDEPSEVEGQDEPAPAAPPPPPQPMPGRALLADYDVDSRIVGGMGAYYIHIDYPMEAIRENVQGRLMLHFTIGTDGRATDVVVAESLHPLCDSAAVAALRHTQFIPAREDGEPVPIRVKLPVRFTIQNPPSVVESAALRQD